MEGNQFLHNKNSKLHISDNVLHEQKRLDRLGEKTTQKPASKIEDWLTLLERTHTGHKDDPRILERIKKSYHKLYVIKESSIPESVFLLEQRIARNLGHGEIEITDEFKQEKTKQIISDQEHSLDKWIDYLTSPDANYPTWAKYWAFTSMVTMGKFEKSETEDGKEIASFKKRDPTTVAAFPPMNARALAMAVSVIEAKAKENAKQKKERLPIENVSAKLNAYEFKELVELENFSKLYTQFLIELPEYSAEGLRETRGEWVKYKKGSEPDALVASLDGHPLEWCTANIDTARNQLQGGDFYVYYSFDSNGTPTIPRVAIRMDENGIAEVRGIAVDQNLDPYISDVVTEKMTQFPDGEKYNKKSADMKRVTEIEDRVKQSEELSKEDLLFLYQMGNKIEGFGYEEDPRIKEIISTRNLKGDISTCTGFLESEISTTQEEALVPGVKYHYGNLKLRRLTNAEGLTLPESIGGYLDLSGIKSAEGLTLPENIGGYLDLSSLTKAEGLTFPKSIGGYLNLRGLTNAEGLTFPENIGGYLDLESLTNAEGLILPESVGHYLDLGSLTNAEGLTFPESIGGYLNLSSLTKAEGLTFPKSIGGYLNLVSLTNAEGLTLPESIGGYLDLSGIKSAEELTLPKSIGGYLNLESLTSAQGLILPESVGGYLILESLTSAEGLILPESVGGTLNLRGLTSAEGLILPKIVDGTLDLRSLTSAEGLTFPKSIGGDLNLSNLTSAEGLTLPESVGGYLNLKSLTSVERRKLRERYPDYDTKAF